MEYPDWLVLAQLLRWALFMLFIFILFLSFGLCLIMAEKLLSEKVKKVWPHDAIVRFNTFVCWAIVGLGALVLLLAIVDWIVHRWFD